MHVNEVYIYMNNVTILKFQRWVNIATVCLYLLSLKQRIQQRGGLKIWEAIAYLELVSLTSSVSANSLLSSSLRAGWLPATRERHLHFSQQSQYAVGDVRFSLETDDVKINASGPVSANFIDWWFWYRVKFPSNECHWTLLMVSQHWFR